MKYLGARMELSVPLTGGSTRIYAGDNHVVIELTMPNPNFSPDWPAEAAGDDVVIGPSEQEAQDLVVTMQTTVSGARRLALAVATAADVAAK